MSSRNFEGKMGRHKKRKSTRVHTSLIFTSYRFTYFKTSASPILEDFHSTGKKGNIQSFQKYYQQKSKIMRKNSEKRNLEFLEKKSRNFMDEIERPPCDNNLVWGRDIYSSSEECTMHVAYGVKITICSSFDS